MLKKLSVESYRTLRNTTVEFLNGLNIIIGKNGVGKSNLLKFVGEYTGKRIGFGAWGRPSLRGSYSYILSQQGESGEDIELSIEVQHIHDHVKASEPVEIDIAIRRKVNGVQDYYCDDVDTLDKRARGQLDREIDKAAPFGNAYVTFETPSDAPYVSRASSLLFDEHGILEWDPSMFRFSGLFESIIHRRIVDLFTKGRFDNSAFKEELPKLFIAALADVALNETLRRFSNIDEVRLGPNINLYRSTLNWVIENLVLEFKVDDRWMPWSYLSDGTKRSFYLIAQVAYAKNELVLIEEPELGLHPTQLFNLMTFIKEQAQSKQIILSTHSPIVLDILDETELDHILIARLNKGVSSFSHLSEEAKAKARRYMTEVGNLSDFWLNSNMEDND